MSADTLRARVLAMANSTAVLSMDQVELLALAVARTALEDAAKDTDDQADGIDRARRHAPSAAWDHIAEALADTLRDRARFIRLRINQL